MYVKQSTIHQSSAYVTVVTKMATVLCHASVRENYSSSCKYDRSCQDVGFQGLGGRVKTLDTVTVSVAGMSIVVRIDKTYAPNGSAAFHLYQACRCYTYRIP